MVHPIASIAVEQQREREIRMAMIEAAVKLEHAAEFIRDALPLYAKTCVEAAAKLRQHVGSI